MAGFAPARSPEKSTDQIGIKRRELVAIGVNGDRNRGMTHARFDRSWVGTVCNAECNVRVTQIVLMHPTVESSLHTRLACRPPEVGISERVPQWRRENQGFAIGDSTP
jgi:hypothetical protein